MDGKKTAIKTEKLSKIYRIGVKDNIHEHLGNAIFDFIKSPIKNYRKYRSLYRFEDIDFDQVENDNISNVIWALRDVSFQVEEGEVVGIIGANGAGKSTLLKILSRITEPTQGFAAIKGKISSLLEIGTGFHQELTGRENIYLNGTILGMTKKDIDAKFDTIVDFSGVEKYIDTPVKRYSSGMGVRLAFSVAAHLEPDILLIDEVLAVGDFDFQKKCLNKMQDVGQQGRTVLFVSHNMAAITRLCSRAILLENGQIKADGPSSEVVAKYMTSGTGLASERKWNSISKAPGGEIARLCSISVKDENDQVLQYFDIRKPITIEMEYDVLQSGYKLLPHHILFNEEGTRIFETVDTDPDWKGRKRPAGRYVCSATIPGNMLQEGILYVQSGLLTLEPQIWQFDEKDVVSFQVVDSLDGTTARGEWSGVLPGAVRPLLKWTNVYEKQEF
jgi:lipopolysaccharide transport system ATP-binding protein